MPRTAHLPTLPAFRCLMLHPARLVVVCLFALICGIGGNVARSADDSARAEHPGDSAGKSGHGEVFDEGPRQAAYLMNNVGKVNFPCTTKNAEAQKFVNQGVAQLHGFWYFESERSFRQAAALDPDCAIAYWGMALSNMDNTKRGKGFIEEAMKRKKSLSERENLYLDALDAWFKETKKKERGEAYAKALERILYKFPDDIEAKAFLALQLWGNRNNGSTISSFLAIDALLKQVLAVEPMHPCHHYVIHLWDYEKAELALDSASKCGQAAPGIAHMWHMPGHIYSRLNRYQDAVWQQEASARVDHAHMMRDRILPDQIHNFAHNNEWLIRNLSYIGRVRDGIDLSLNMTELPRHPKYNTISKRGSTWFGRLRMQELLIRYELWDEYIALANTPYLEATDEFDEQVKRLRNLGVAQIRKGDAAAGEATLKTLSELLAPHKKTQDEAIAKAETKALEDQKKANEAKAKADLEAMKKADAGVPGQPATAETIAESQTRTKTAVDTEAKTKKEADEKLTKARDEAKRPTAGKVDPLTKALDEMRGHQLVARSDFKAGLELLKKAGGVDDSVIARVQLQAGLKDDAEKTIRNYVNGRKNEVHPLAVQVEILWQIGKKDDAKKAFEELRKLSGTIDRELPPFARLDPIGVELGYGSDWRTPVDPAKDTGVRPELATLGPFRWQPSTLPSDWTLNDAAGKPVKLSDYRGKPVVIIHYLGFGCLHCVEQLKKFAPRTADFQAAGISLLAVSTDDAEMLAASVEGFGKGPFAFPLLSDSKLDVFKAWRTYDDFEKKPLHGTFLIDGEGRVRWQDISHEPFMDVDFVLKESKRLLEQSAVKHPARTPTPPPMAVSVAPAKNSDL